MRLLAKILTSNNCANSAVRAGEFARGTPLIGSYTDEASWVFLQALRLRQVCGPLQARCSVRQPGETLALNLGGGLAGTAASLLAALQQQQTLFPGAGSGSRGAQIARAALAGATTGAVEGGIYGSGEGTSLSSKAEAGRGRQSGTGGQCLALLRLLY